MAKDTYYFSHDSNARNDIKIVRLRRALGMEGYGIYFALIEVLREQENYKLPLEALTDIAFDLHTSDEKVRAVVMSYDLFMIENDEFFSARLLRSMDEFNTKRSKYVEAGRKGGEASVKHRLSIAQPLKESKVKEIKEKEDVYRSFKHLKLSLQDFDKLLAKPYTKIQIDKILDSIENYSKNKNYTSLYLTCIKWLEKEYPATKQESEPYYEQP